MTFAEKLQSLRKAKGLSQEYLAEKCGVSRQSVSKWETGLGYPETEKLLVLCEVLDANLDYLLRDQKLISQEEITEAKHSPYISYVGKWVQVFLNDREFNGFYCVALICIQKSFFIFMDEKRKLILIEQSSIRSISEFEKSTSKLPTIPKQETVAYIDAYFLKKKCDLKLKQENPIWGYNKPGGFYSILFENISDNIITIQDVNGNRQSIKLADVLFIKEI